MPPPSVTSPFNYLVEQIKKDLRRAVTLCSEIKTNRHVGSYHAQLDSLQSAVSGGESFVEAHYVTGLPGADSDNGDGMLIFRNFSYDSSSKSFTDL